MTENATGDPFLTHSQAAELLHVSVRTVGRLLNDGALDYVRQRTFRKPYAGQVDHIVAAIKEGRTGSIKEFAAEWKAARQHMAAPAEVAA